MPTEVESLIEPETEPVEPSSMQNIIIEPWRYYCRELYWEIQNEYLGSESQDVF